MCRWPAGKRNFAGASGCRLHIRAIVRSDRGCVRQNNEDRAAFLFVGGSKTDFLGVLADGMGGHEQGEVASAMVVDILCPGGGNAVSGKPLKWLEGMLQAANREIYSLSRQQEVVMGTTCTVLLINDGRFYCAHVGDSRMYLADRKGIRQLTEDHTWIREMVRSGKITKEEAVNHPDRNLLLKALGTTPEIAPDLFGLSGRVKPGSRFLLCSDGLYEVVKEPEMLEILTGESLKQAAEALIVLAKERGGHDNITVLIIEITERREV